MGAWRAAWRGACACVIYCYFLSTFPLCAHASNSKNTMGAAR